MAGNRASSSEEHDHRLPRQLRLHAAGDVVTDAFLEVELDLVVDLRGRILPEDAPPPPPP